jgi:hypothetical protein
MKKIIIDPHYCSSEELEELKEYLEEKCWDWKEVTDKDLVKDLKSKGLV